MASVDYPSKDYVRHLRAKLVEAETGLLEVSQRYGAAKARFDLQLLHRGVTPETGMVQYQELKGLHPELQYWYSKVEHFQRELAAYGAALIGLEAAGRMLSDVWRRPQPGGKRGPRRGNEAPEGDATPVAGS